MTAPAERRTKDDSAMMSTTVRADLTFSCSCPQGLRLRRQHKLCEPAVHETLSANLSSLCDI
jgi:hypothetical protein